MLGEAAIIRPKIIVVAETTFPRHRHPLTHQEIQ